jgi:membrane-bound lytic murein transglycosylase D
MSGTQSKKIKWIALVWTLFVIARPVVAAETFPEIPNKLSFGGITVNFDRGAQVLIEEDVRSLMSNKKFWEEKMDRAILYFPIVESILMDEEVPIDFKYLAIQESSFKPDVISSSNAVGYWQFKSETAIGLNLRVDAEIDERKNISSSTHAAAWYLKKNYTQFNNWVSTLYSYYLGATGVKKVVPSNWAYAREITLSNKTDRYMLRFFAHKIALESGIEKYRSNNRIALLESDYGKGRSLDEIGRALDIDAAELKNYNRWLNSERIPTDGEYLVLLPVPLDKIESVKEKLTIQVSPIQSIAYDNSGYPILKKSQLQSSDKNAPTFYEINGLPGIEARPGDRPKVLAQAGKLSTPKFLRYNDMIRDMPLIPGKVYYLAKKNKKAATPYHTAQPGDTWQSVSQQYALRLVNLLKYNRTISRNYPIQTGQVLWLTEKRPRKQGVEIKVKEPVKAAPVETPIAAAEPEKLTPAAPASSESIPTTRSGRKKYTPVLVDKTQTNTEPKDTAPAASQQAPTQTQPANLYKNSGDRVVVISKDANEETSRTTVAEKKPEVNAGTAKTAVTKAPAVNTAGTTKATPAKEPVTIEASTTGSGFEYHTVEKGQTYFSISKLHELSVKELLALNDLTEKDKLVVGQRLRVLKPEGTTISSGSSSVAATPTKSNSKPVVHTVVSGETLYRISKIYEVDIEDIKSLNKLSGNSVQLGQKLKIPQKN